MKEKCDRRILVTGGAGYLGSHTTLLLLQAGYDVVVLDNLSNSSFVALERVAMLAGRKAEFVQGDIRDGTLLNQIFCRTEIHGVIHFAGLKAVGESFVKPLEYYDNNVIGSLRLLQAMALADVKNFVFSSSATVYGIPNELPICEDYPLSTTNPYGATKLQIEGMLRDLQCSDSDWSIAILRYFNPAGAHESGDIGENPIGTPSNLMPYIGQVAAGLREKLLIYGNDYNTPDGTGVRDYVHVMDLARAHLLALSALEKYTSITCNLGTGKGFSVLEMVKTFSQVSGQPVHYEFVDRRSGDVAQYYTDPSRAEELLGWRSERSLAEICADHWNWQKKNPEGY